MTTEIKYLDPSPQAIAERGAGWHINHAEKFNNCPVGKSFQLPLKIGTLAGIRSAISRRFNNGEKKFKVVQHSNCYEVYRKE